MLYSLLRPFILAFRFSPLLFFILVLFGSMTISASIYGVEKVDTLMLSVLDRTKMISDTSDLNDTPSDSAESSSDTSLHATTTSPAAGTLKSAPANQAPISPAVQQPKASVSSQSQVSAAQVQGNSPAPAPPANTKPTDASTGPRTAPTLTRAGGTITGSYSNVHFTSGVTTSGPLYLTDCTIDGAFKVYDGPVVLDHSDVNSWTGITTDNMDPNKPVFTARFSKFTGPLDNDAMRIGAKSKFGDNSHYANTLFEDSIIHSPVTSIPVGAHLDVLQFGGGKNSTFNRVVFSYAAADVQNGATQYINNGTKNSNVVFNYLWIDGGPMSYTIGGPVTINNCVIARTAKLYGYFYPNRGNTVTNCTDDTGKVLTST